MTFDPVTGISVRIDRYAAGRRCVGAVHPSKVCLEARVISTISVNVWPLVSHVIHRLLAGFAILMGRLHLFVRKLHVEPHTLAGDK